MNSTIELTEAQAIHYRFLAGEIEQAQQRLTLFSDYLILEHKIEGEGWRFDGRNFVREQSTEPEADTSL